MSFRVFQADALDALREMPDNSIDSLVTDPPAGIGFMGKEWDQAGGVGAEPQERDAGSIFPQYRAPAITAKRLGSQRLTFIASLTPIFEECLRVLKPGAHGIVWALPRTSHWTATALEDAGFEIRDVVTHLFGSGFPKSLDVSKAIAKNSGGPLNAKREPITNLAKKWEGWGTALKPASEHWIVVRKPLSAKNVAANVLEHGTGALNIDGCRIGTEILPIKCPDHPAPCKWHQRSASLEHPMKHAAWRGVEGRWPANVVLSHHPLCEVVGERTVGKGETQRPGGAITPGFYGKIGEDAERGSKPEGPMYGEETVEVWDCVPGCAVAQLDAQSGETQSSAGLKKRAGSQNGTWGGTFQTPRIDVDGGFDDKGGASRFFYVAKPSSDEKQNALASLSLFDTNPADKPIKNAHPTVKPVDLMRYFCRLVTPPGGTVLDCFAGSGTTGVAALAEGFDVILIEREPDYAATVRARCERAAIENGRVMPQGEK